MSEARPSTSAPAVLRAILGRRPQDLRLDAGASLEDAAQALRVKVLTIRRLEKTEVALKPLYHLERREDVVTRLEAAFPYGAADVVGGQQGAL